MKAWKSSLAASAIALAIAVPASGQTMPVAYQGSSVLNTGSQNTGIQYSTGGFGLEDRAEMQRDARAYNVLFMFAAPTGQFLVADSVAVKKGGAEVLNVSDAGPLLYMNLPNGTYTVQANYNGVVQSRTINVGRGTPEVLMRWQADLD